MSIKVLNADTDEVIREIPPEKSLDMLQKMWEMAGILNLVTVLDSIEKVKEVYE